jgi:Tol biopolymer transport system component/DNA-binding winged helix-turn-helix (wHTH) protein
LQNRRWKVLKDSGKNLEILESSMPLEVTPAYQFGVFQLNIADRQLKRDGNPVSLTPKLFDLLVFLLENHGRAISKDELLNKVWPDSFVSEENLSRHISMLRKALGEDSGGQRYIETLPKFGYRFAESVTLIQSATNPVAVPAPTSGTFEFADLVETSSESPNRSDPKPILLPDETDENEFPAELFANEPVSEPPANNRRKMLIWSLTLFVGVSLASVIYWLVKRKSDDYQTPRIVPFTSFLNREHYPTFSPDDKMLAFTWDGQEGDNIDIYVKLLDSETPLRLTTDPAADISPAWSPDGRHLAFVRIFNEENKSGKNGAGIYIVSVLGGPERELISGIWSAGPTVPSGRLAWSPDGNSLVFAGRPDNSGTDLDLYLYDFQKQEKRQLTNSAEDDRFPTISPDGKTLAFIRGLDEVFVMPAAGGQERQLTFDNKRIFGLAWSSDGSELIFSSARAGNPTLWKIAAGGGTPEALLPGGEQVGNLAVAHQSKRLIYSQTIVNQNIRQLEVAATNAPPTSPAMLIRSTRQELQPQFSADGKHIAFISTRSGNRELWLADSEGKNQMQLTRFNGPYVGSPRFSPDGSQIVFDCTCVNDQRDIFVVSKSGGAVRRLTTENGNEFLPSWSHDGQWIYFGRAGDQEQIWKIPAAGGEARQVTQNGGRKGFESPDGNYLYFSKKPDEPGIWRIQIASGEQKLILPEVPVNNWAMSQQGIYFVNQKTPPRPTLEFFSFATEQVSIITTLPKWVLNDFTASPDGRKFLWSQVDRNDSDLILVENFR